MTDLSWIEAIQGPAITHGEGATQAEIQIAERSLGMIFPDAYRGFLRSLGWLDVDTAEIFGLGRDVPTHLELVRVTVAERGERRPFLPAQLLPLRNDGLGNIYALDLERTSGRDAPVVLWDHEFDEDQAVFEEASGFENWLQALVADVGREP